MEKEINQSERAKISDLFKRRLAFQARADILLKEAEEQTDLLEQWTRLSNGAWQMIGVCNCDMDLAFDHGIVALKEISEIDEDIQFWEQRLQVADDWVERLTKRPKFAS